MNTHASRASNARYTSELTKNIQKVPKAPGFEGGHSHHSNTAPDTLLVKKNRVERIYARVHRPGMRDIPLTWRSEPQNSPLDISCSETLKTLKFQSQNNTWRHLAALMCPDFDGYA